MAAIIPIRAFNDNYMWLLREGRCAAVVDPGDARPVFAFLEREGLTLTAILATHHHRDHVGGVEALVERFRTPVLGPARESIPARTQALVEGDCVQIPGMGAKFDVIDIPGHTAGHIAFTGRVDAVPVLFCGDTLFAAGCGRLFEGTPAQMWSSLSKLAALPPETEVYCGHEYTLANLRFAAAVEPDNRAIADRFERERAKRDDDRPTLPSTIADELATNPFLRAASSAVRASAEAHTGTRLGGTVEVFAALREWKNRF